VAGRDDGDDAAVVSLTAAGDVAVISTADFFAPVVDDSFDGGRIAAGAVWATDAGGTPGAPVIGELVPRGEYVLEIR
jgi:selenide,water dikinase